MSHRNLDNELKSYFKRFDRNHEEGRSRLMNALSEAGPSIGRIVREQARSQHVRVRRGLRIAMSAAAVLLVGVGVFWKGQSGSQHLSPGQAWATALERVNHVRSLKLRAMTQSGSRSSSLELVWRVNGDFRMSFSNGIIHTQNENHRASFDPRKGAVTLRDPFNGMGPLSLILGELGQLFTQNRTLSQPLLDNSTLVSEEPIEYKGQQAVSRLFVKNGQNELYHRCIVGVTEPTIIYEAATFRKDQPDQPLYHIEILEMDKEYPDYLFDQEASGGGRLVDLRTKKQAHSTSR